ncbi:exodeoxyribonuclease VII large subunit [Haloarcula salinisoli]|uniref:Exodeoxyribonuclease VII large subunit n=1 Tax=Haloarcula salinisoli TaxID=2487746 RepID=A0A8J7YLT7_9EURY|nr:exodeoxyribonuclease VII large subunit [Halomicroarcula salinisoli]MBX0305686.1 exodeoxyribonuclease VII large subunit [Halomicroarcula salinisoli]
MGTEPDATPDSDLATLQERLDTESVTFVDAMNDELATLIEDANHLGFDYLVGDVADYGPSSNGHLHFDLVHNESSIHCVCFQFRVSRLDADLEDGLQVAVKGDLSYYEDGGSVSVIVEDVVTVGGGVYQETYEQNRATLAEDGLLDPDTKQALPELPSTVGLVTSADSDAREDAVTSIHERYPDVDIIVHDSPVQGMDAMAGLMEAISVLDDDASVDVIVLTRGGGSDKHLRVFNETPLCRVIHNASTPVVVGVGHENDRTLADEVADRRVMTPTHVGGIVPEKATLVDELQTLSTRLDTTYETAVIDKLETYQRELDRAYESHVETACTELRTDLDHAYETFATERLTTLQNRLDSARDQYDERRQHRQQTAQYRRQRRLLIAALLVLGLAVAALAAYIIL